MRLSHRLRGRPVTRAGGGVLRWAVLVFGGATAGLAGWGAVAAAQQAPASRGASTAPPAGLRTSAPAPDPSWRSAYPGIAESPADTGRMLPGWHDFSRTSWLPPLTMCETFVNYALGRVWRHAERDSGSYAARVQLPLPEAVRQVATRCGVDTLLPRALQTLAQGQGGYTLFQPAFQLALLLGRDSLTLALVQQFLPHLPQSSWNEFLSQLVFVKDGEWGPLMETHPVRLSLITRYEQLVDSLIAAGRVSPLLRVHPQQWLAQHWLRVGDTAQMRSAYEAFIATCVQLDPRGMEVDACHHTENTDLGAAYDVVLMLEVIEHGLRSQQVVDVLNRRARALRNDSTAQGVVPLEFSYLGKRFVWPDAPYWYSPQGAPLVLPPANDGSLPRGLRHTPTPALAGKVVLVWDVGAHHDHRLLRPGSPLYFARMTGFLRRLLATYGSQGLELVVVEHTFGVAAGLGAVPPEQEAPAIRQFYQEQLKLPVTVIVDTMPYRYFHDGRRLNGYTAWQRHYVPFQLPAYEGVDGRDDLPAPFVLDRHGVIRLYGMTTSADFGWGNGLTEDEIVELFIRQALHEP